MSEETSSVLLTGATGFIGAHVLRVLLEAKGGEREDGRPSRGVRALVRTEESAGRVRALGAEPLVADLLHPTKALLSAIGEARYIVHCASPALSSDTLTVRPSMDRTLLGAIDPSRVARLVYVCGSSYLGCGEGNAPLDETSASPPFGIAPSFDEGIKALRASSGRLDYAIAYVGGVYGRGSWFLEEYLRHIREGKPVVVREPAPLWPYIHIDDCARAIALLLSVSPAALEAVGREIIIADDEPTPMDVFVEAVFRAAGREPDLARHDAEALHRAVPPHYSMYLGANMPHSNARLRRLGFVCRYPTIREGVPALGLASPSDGPR